MVKSRLGREKLIAFGYFGGKFTHLDWLLPLLPACYHYCEPFGGSASVLLNRSISPLETYNDLDGEIVNFFKVLRSQKEKFIEQVALTPYSREEFAQACTVDNTLSELERARRFYVRARQVRGGNVQSAKESGWSSSVGNTKVSSKCKKYFSSIKKLDNIAKRFESVQIECRPAIKLIQFYDSEGTLFYADPPYVHSTRSGKDEYCQFEMSDEDHILLAKELNNIKGKAAVSGYDCELINKIYPSPKWKKHYNKLKVLSSSDNNRKAREVLWVNYDDIQIA